MFHRSQRVTLNFIFIFYNLILFSLVLGTIYKDLKFKFAWKGRASSFISSVYLLDKQALYNLSYWSAHQTHQLSDLTFDALDLILYTDVKVYLCIK